LQYPSILIVPRSVATPSFSSPRFSILPTTPTAEITRSAVTCCVFPSLSIVAVTLSAFLSSFVTLVPDTEILYKVTDTYSPEHDRSIRFDDPAIGIAWPSLAGGFQLSDKDRKAPLLGSAEVFA